MNWSRTILSILMSFGGVLGGRVIAAPRPDLVARVAAGELKEARASWWGFDTEDSTRFLQQAIDSKVPRLIIDRQPTPWFVLPLKGVSNQELFFEPGTVVQAKRGAYQGRNDCLLSFSDCTNVRLIGPNATLRMWHEDYMKPPYEKSEWRHALSLRSVRKALIEGLTIEDSGGDGIYVSRLNGKLNRCLDVVIRGVTCRRNHRQGISVISAENLLIENTVLCDTFGTPPAAGIDFEPNKPDEVLKNCVMRSCRAFNNEGCGYDVYLGNLCGTSEPIDLRFKNCTAIGDKTSFAFNHQSRRATRVGGRVVIENCSFETPRLQTVELSNFVGDALKYDIRNSRIVTTNAIGERQTTWIDETWMKRLLPCQQDADLQLPRLTNIDFSRLRVRDAKPGEVVKLQPLSIREQGVYIVYADSARTLHFEGAVRKVGKREPPGNPVLVTDTEGREVARLAFKRGSGDRTLSFAAPAKSFYRLQFELGTARFTMKTADAPIALDVTADSQHFIACTGSFWFWVPEETERLVFLMNGSPGEKAHGELRNPAGASVWEEDNIKGWTKSVCAPPQAGLWQVILKRPSEKGFEDFRVDVLGIPGFFFLTPDRIWTF